MLIVSNSSLGRVLRTYIAIAYCPYHLFPIEIASERYIYIYVTKTKKSFATKVYRYTSSLSITHVPTAPYKEPIGLIDVVLA